MRAISILRQGNPVAPNVDLLEDWPEPVPGAGEAVVRGEAAALNHRDLYLGRGIAGREARYPLVPGEDGCGVVESIGDGVDPAWLERRVIVNAAIPKYQPAHPDVPASAPDRQMLGEASPGTLAQKFAAPVANLVAVGDADPVRAAAFGLVHLTAWRMLVTRAGLRPGMTVLIPGVGGGVALALLAIARHFGCATIVTSRHGWKLERARRLGVDHAILDTGGDFSREVRSITGKRGVDIVADSVGKAVHGACLKSLARGGVYVTCGTTSGGDAVTDLTRLYWNECAIVGSTMGTTDEMRQVVALFRRGLLQPVVDEVYPAAKARAAFERLESSEQFGKVVVTWA